jgi:hypothetical protein
MKINIMTLEAYLFICFRVFEIIKVHTSYDATDWGKCARAQYLAQGLSRRLRPHQNF